MQIYYLANASLILYNLLDLVVSTSAEQTAQADVMNGVLITGGVVILVVIVIAVVVTVSQQMKANSNETESDGDYIHCIILLDNNYIRIFFHSND